VELVGTSGCFTASLSAASCAAAGKPATDDPEIAARKRPFVASGRLMGNELRARAWPTALIQRIVRIATRWSRCDRLRQGGVLSYASQDAEAAKRICDALRAAGIEAWFDQSELREAMRGIR